MSGTHYIVCINPLALKFLTQENCLLGSASLLNRPVEQGDALLARDYLQGHGFSWGKDFYLKKVQTSQETSQKT